MQQQLLYAFGQCNYGELGVEQQYINNNSNNLVQYPLSIENNFLNKKNIKFIVKGAFHTLIVIEEKDFDLIYGSGANSLGQLGLESFESYNFTEITWFTKLKKRVKFISCGNSHTFIVTEDFKCFGFGKYFQNRNFLEIEELNDDIVKNIQKVVCGFNHTAIILQNGDFYVHGENKYQQLEENENLQMIDRFKKSKFNEPIKEISFGVSHCLMITINGEVYGSGFNSKFHQLGINNNIRKNYTFTKVFNIKSQKVYCGNFHSFILTNHFELYGAGWNVSGELCLGYNSIKVSTFKRINLPLFESTNNLINDFEMSVGHQHVFLKIGNEIYCGGYNATAALGLNCKFKNSFVKHFICEEDNRVNEVICGGHGTFFVFKKKNQKGQLLIDNLKKLMENNEQTISDISFI